VTQYSAFEFINGRMIQDELAIGSAPSHSLSERKHDYEQHA